MKKALAGALLVGVLATVSVGLPAFATPRGAGHQAPGHDRLQAAVDDLHDLGITGVQGFARVGNRVTTARSGVGNIVDGSPVPVNGYLRVGSETKTFVAVTLLQLVGEKQLSLEDPVERWLPGVMSGDGGKITVRQVLQHTSGIPDYLDYVVVQDSAEDFRIHRLDHHDPTELVAAAMKHPPLFPPGTSWSYSNTNYLLAGMIIESVTGHSWVEEVRSRILKTLNLRRTYVPVGNPTIRNPHSEGYNQFVPGGSLVDTTDFDPSIADSAGALVTTPTDLDDFWQALQAGRLLAPAQMAEMHRTVPAPQLADALPGAQYGLGIFRVEDSCGGYWSHPGNVPGMTTLNGVSSDGTRSVVLFLNTALANPTAVYHRANQLIDETLCS